MERLLSRALSFAFVLVAVALVAADSEAQTNRRSTPIPAPTATPQPSEPMIISRADEFPDNNPQAIPPDPNEQRTGGVDAASLLTLEQLGNRIKNLESGQKVEKPDPDQKQKRLLLNLDILTRAEQRSESLRKQVFELLEKESSIKTKLDSLEYDLRPESIDRTTAIVGSLRPEEIRASRKKSLESERTNLQNLLTEIQRTKTRLDMDLQRSDALVERLRNKFEKEIDTALDDEPKDND
jgi:hypothetical protein